MLASFINANLPEADIVRRDESTLEEIVEYIEWLMRYYCRQPSLVIARIIVFRLELLKSREEICEISNAGWSCDRLIKVWNYLAAEKHPAASW